MRYFIKSKQLHHILHQLYPWDHYKIRFFDNFMKTKYHQQNIFEKHVSEVGFEPTPTFVDQKAHEL